MSLSLTDYRIRTKIVFALLLPVFGLLWIAGTAIERRYSTVDSTQSMINVASLATELSGLVHELQKERGLSAGFIASKGSTYRDQLTSQRGSVDEARRRLEAAQTIVTKGAGSESARKAAQTLGMLNDTRNRVDGLSIPGSESFAYYTDTIGSLLAEASELLQTPSDPVVTNLAAAHLQLVLGKESAGQERATGNAAAASGTFAPANLKRLVELAAFQEAYFRNFERLAPANLVAELKSASISNDVEAMRQGMVRDLPAGRVTSFTAPDWFRVTTDRINRLKQVEDNSAAILVGYARAVHDGALNDLVVTTAVTTILLIITILLASFIVRGISAPLSTITTSMRRLAEGDTDIEIDDFKRSDEIGTMTDALRTFHHAMLDRTRHAEALQAAEVEHQKAMREQLLAMTRSVEEDLAGAVREVGEISGEMEKNAVDVAAQISMVQSEAAKVMEVARVSNERTTEVASITEEMAATGQEISRQATHASSIAKSGVSRAQNVVTEIDRLKAATGRIGAIAKAINDIATKTNLLALNATIEAARAGDAGRGFAVVAGEVKALARQTGQATDEITQLISSVHGAVSSCTSAIEVVISGIVEIEGGTTIVASAVEEQNAANQQMSQHAASLARDASHLSQIVGDISTRSDACGDLSRKVEASARRTHGAVEKLSERLVLVMRQSVSGDRREDDRIPISLPITVDGLSGKVRGNTIDISVGGCLIRTDQKPTLKQNDEFNIDIERIGTIPAIFLGTSNRGHHVEFNNPNSEISTKIKHLVDELLEADRSYIELAQRTARDVSSRLTIAMNKGCLSAEDLFDKNYQKVPDTSPQQYITRYSEVFDDIIWPAIEPVITAQPGIIFCAPTDRGGYIATHNKKYSAPQRPGEVVWNTANCRNRRIFNDQAGLTAARCNRSFVLQAYDRDMGGGQMVLLKEVDVPIVVFDRHWGAVRLGYKI